jgi:hypothetical protein
MFAIASAIVSNPPTRTGFYMVPSILCTQDGSKKREEEKMKLYLAISHVGMEQESGCSKIVPFSIFRD